MKEHEHENGKKDVRKRLDDLDRSPANHRRDRRGRRVLLCTRPRRAHLATREPPLSRSGLDRPGQKGQDLPLQGPQKFSF